MSRSLRDLFPLRLLIGGEDVTFLLGSGFTFSNVDPGGYEAASFSIPRDMPQTLRGQPVRLDCGLQVAWEGRVSQIQRSLGNRTAIVCEGYGALLKDKSASMVFIDRDLTRWQGSSISRQIALSSNNPAQFSFQVGADTKNLLPGLVISGQGQLSGFPIIDMWYDSGPSNKIARARITSGNATVYTFPDANNILKFVSADDDAFGGGLDNDSNIAAATPSRDWTLPTARRYLVIEHEYNAAGPSLLADKTYGYSLQNVNLIGNHGLTLRGSPPSDGFYPSDIVTWVEQQIPGIQAGVIQQTDASGYIVQHQSYYTPVTLDQIVNDMAVAQGWHWGVWESLTPLTGSATPRLDFRPRPAAGAFTAFCRRSDCDTLDIREDLSGQYDTAVVTYTDVAGKPGAVTVTADNPVLDEAGISGRTVILSGGTMAAAQASLYGAEALVLLNQQARVAGTADLIAAIDGPSGPMAPWLLKSGIDRLRIGDLPSTTAFGTYNDVPISRVECSAGSSGFNTSVELGSGANLIETLNARLAAAATLAAQGGS